MPIKKKNNAKRVHETNNRAAQQCKWLHAQASTLQRRLATAIQQWTAGGRQAFLAVCHMYIHRQIRLRSGKLSRQGWQKKKKVEHTYCTAGEEAIGTASVEQRGLHHDCPAMGSKISFSVHCWTVWASVHRCQAREVSHCLGMIWGRKENNAASIRRQIERRWMMSLKFALFTLAASRNLAIGWCSTDGLQTDMKTHTQAHTNKKTKYSTAKVTTWGWLPLSKMCATNNYCAAQRCRHVPNGS